MNCLHCNSVFERPWRSRTLYCSLFCAFWHKVRAPEENGCCLWTGTLDSNGRGHLTFRGKHMLAAHACRQIHGLPHISALDTLHSCHNSRCVALEHILEQGSRTQNMLQSSEAGRLLGVNRYTRKETRL